MKITYIVLKGIPLGGEIEKYTEEVGSRLVGAISVSDVVALAKKY